MSRSKNAPRTALRVTRGLLLALAVTACQADDAPSHARTQARSDRAPAKADATPPSRDPTAGTPADADAPHPSVAPELREGVILHLLFGSMSRTVERVRQRLAPSSLAWVLSDDVVRKLLRAQFSALRLKGNIAPTNTMVEHFDVVKPTACALIDPAALTGAGACVFGYSGGTAQFITDLDALRPRVARVGDDGHTAQFKIDGEHPFFVDALSDSVVVSMNPDAFARIETFLARATADPPKLRDFEMVVYPGDYSERYLQLFATQLRARAAGERAGADVRAAVESSFSHDFGSFYWIADQFDPGYLEASMRGLEEVTTDDARELARLADEVRATLNNFDNVGFNINLEADGLVLGMSYEGAADGALDPALRAARRVSKAALEAAPPNAIWTGASTGGWLTEQERADGQDHVSRVLATLLALVYQGVTEQPRARIEPELAELSRARAREDDDRGWLLFRDEEGALGLIVVHAREAARVSREQWNAWTSRFTPELVLGPELSRHVTWAFKPAAFEVAGAPVDRWVFRLVPEADGLEGGLLPDELRAWTIQSIGREFYVDRVALDGDVYFALAVTPTADLLTRARAARRGERTLIDPGVPAIMERSEHATLALGINARLTFEWLIGLLPESEQLDLPDRLGGDVSDIYRVDRIARRGGAAELVLSQHFLDDLRASFSKLARLGM